MFWLLSKKVHIIVGIIGATALNGVLAPALMIPIAGVGLFVSLLAMQV